MTSLPLPHEITYMIINQALRSLEPNESDRRKNLSAFSLVSKQWNRLCQSLRWKEIRLEGERALRGCVLDPAFGSFQGRNLAVQLSRETTGSIRSLKRVFSLEGIQQLSLSSKFRKLTPSVLSTSSLSSVKKLEISSSLLSQKRSRNPRLRRKRVASFRLRRLELMNTPYRLLVSPSMRSILGPSVSSLTSLQLTLHKPNMDQATKIAIEILDTFPSLTRFHLKIENLLTRNEDSTRNLARKICTLQKVQEIELEGVDLLVTQEEMLILFEQKKCLGLEELCLSGFGDGEEPIELCAFRELCDARRMLLAITEDVEEERYSNL